MSEANNGESLSGTRPLAPKRHNAKHCSLADRHQIINAFANGDSKRAIARALRVSNNTVDAVAEQEWQQVAARKERIAAQCERNATLAANQLAERLETEKLSANQLVPVLGVSVDKLLALRGEPQMTIAHEHLHAHLTDEDLLEAMLRRQAMRLRASTDGSASGENAQQKEG